jgi:hypothetical protein
LFLVKKNRRQFSPIFKIMSLNIYLNLNSKNWRAKAKRILYKKITLFSAGTKTDYLTK